MSEDNLYLLLCFLIFGLTLAILILRSKNKLRTLGINLIIAALYGSFFIYNIEFNGRGGTGLVWFAFLLFSIGLHWLINVIGIILTFTKNQRPHPL